MVRLYKALCETGASMGIIPSKKHMDEIVIIFRYKKAKHIYSYSLINFDEDMVVNDLYQFTRYTDCLNDAFYFA